MFQSSHLISILIALIISCNICATPIAKRLGNAQSMIKVTPQNHSLLLMPIQESAPESRLQIIKDNTLLRNLNVRLAIDSIDYYMPLNLAEFNNECVINILNCDYKAICWDNLKFSDTFDSKNIEKHRPSFHFAPAYGWMNDPNGMFYKDGEYHLYYQYNPYGSMWGNMHWGHATSKNLVDWNHKPFAIAPDGLGAIFSGSAVVDSLNTAGFGSNAVVAFYTSAAERQTQSIAYSLDGGLTFTKYKNNPVLVSEVLDFRDPKVMWHTKSQKWIMVLAVKDRMEFYSSKNLLDWKFESSFGENYGSHGGVWECPDLLEMSVDGTDKKRWVLICNINPGGPFGGSATQYFVGDFDGSTFTCEDSPSETKWMDYGKDHYAAVSWSNAPQGRHTIIAWMSNWQYANVVPTKQFRSAMSLPRDLGLFEYKGEHYVSVTPSAEVAALRTSKPINYKLGKISGTRKVSKFATNNSGRYQIEFEINNNDATIVGIELSNKAGEKVNIFYDLSKGEVVMDRTKSGAVDFNPDFPAITKAPIYNSSSSHGMKIFVDNSSIELFDTASRWAMTNLVFPSQPYTQMSIYTQGGSCKVEFCFAEIQLTVKPITAKPKN